MRSLARLALCSALIAGFPALTAWAGGLRFTAPPLEESPVEGTEVPRRVGSPLAVALSPATEGEWRDRPGGGRTWSLEVHAPGALWLILGFEGARFPEGASLQIFDSAERLVLARDAQSRTLRTSLWTPPVAGDLLRVELLWPEALRAQLPELMLTTVTRGFGSVFDDRHVLGGVEDCNVDVNCSPEGDAWRDERRGVVQMVIGNIGSSCSASLINTTANLATIADPFDQTYPRGLRCAPYVLTADHCFHPDTGGTDGDPASASFVFNYEVDPTGACSGGFAPGVSPQSQVLTGATHVAHYDPSDFYLLLLDDPPPREFAVYLNGWNRSTTPATDVTTIHHPFALPKKVTRSPAAAGPSGDLYGPTHWSVPPWVDGRLRPGSSGAPMFDQNRLVTGQVHGGLGDCGASQTAEFGKLSSSWTGGGAVTSRLSDHLDPLATAVTSLPGLDLQTCLSRAPGVVHVAHTVKDDTVTGNHDGIADPGDMMRLEVELFNGRAVTATNVNATLGPVSSTDVVMVKDAATWSPIGALASATSQAPHFFVQLAKDMSCGVAPQLQLDVTTQQGTTSSLFRLQTGTPAETFRDNGDAGNNGFFCTPGLCTGGDAWTAPAPWTQSCQASPCFDKSWYVPNASLNTNAAIVAPQIRTGNLAAGSRLTFRHYLLSETGADGAVLEYSTNGGASWLDAYPLILDGFYDATIDGTSVIDGRAAWSGIFEDWRTVEVDLDPFALTNGTLDLRWRFVTDSSGSTPAGGGWWVDDVRIVGGGFTCKVPASRHYPGARCLRDEPDDRFPCGQRRPARAVVPSRQR